LWASADFVGFHGQEKGIIFPRISTPQDPNLSAKPDTAQATDLHKSLI
jgi:hypothetical protein